MRFITTALFAGTLGAGLPPWTAAASAPALREQVSLNGTWDHGGAVPIYTGEKADIRTYARKVMIPASWAGKRIAIEFGAVNHVAQIFVDDQQVAEHVGGWIPFSVSLPDTLRPGDAFTLKVVAGSRNKAPIIDPGTSKPHAKTGKPVFPVRWPVGNAWATLDNAYTGIVDDVWLRAYGEACIEDAFIQTSFRDKKIRVDYTLRNSGSAPRTVRVAADVVRAGTGAVEKTIAGTPVTLPPGRTKTVRVESLWENPELWWPDRPTLYHLRSRLIEGDAGKNTLDQETRRFGFREIWTEAGQFRLNGVRLNVTSDYFVWGKENHWPDSYRPEGWRKTIDALKRLNIRAVRLHKQPPPQFVLDAADETGLCLIAESAIDGPTGGATPIKRPDYLANSIGSWIPAWVKGNRNHPSILIWSAMNEMGQLDKTEAQRVGKAIRDLDPTRLIVYEGHSNPETYRGGDPNTDINSRHYPRPFGNKGDVWTGSGEPWGAKPGESGRGIYAWEQFVDPTRPTAAGEALYYPGGEANDAQKRNAWWQGVWTRGMRYTDWASISPASYRWIRKAAAPDDPRIQNLRNAYHPVALFDKGYDELGIAPFVTGTNGPGTLPSVAAGATLKRTLVLYNDEFRDTKVTIEVLVTSGDTVHAKGTKTFDVPLGGHIDIPYGFQVPMAGREMEVVLKTSKGGVTRFEEARRFTVSGAGGAGKSSDVVSIGEAATPLSATPASGQWPQAEVRRLRASGD